MKTFTGVLLAGTAMIVSAPVMAQDIADPDREDPVSAEVGRGNVIIVTAQRREQSLQEVPVSVSVVSGEELQSRQIDGFDQLQYVAPGLTFASGVNARQSATTIRGIGTTLFNPGIEGSVAIAIDGVILGREGAGIFDFADVERVEVLRGPQGTLFGKNASAGVISIVTKQPTDTFEAEASAAYGSFDELNLYGAVSGRVAKGVRARISGYRNTRDGYVDNVFPGATQQELNNRDEFGFRGKFAIDLSPDVELLLSGDYAERNQRAFALTLRQASPGTPGSGLLGSGVPLIPLQAAELGIVPGPENREIGSNGLFLNDTQAYGGSAQLTASIGDHTLVSLTAYRGWDLFDINDADTIPLSLLETNSSDLSLRQFSQEVRLESPSDQTFSYTLGLYYFTQDIDQTQIIRGTVGLDILGLLPPGLLVGTNAQSTFSEDNYAAFAQFELAATDRLSLIAGARLLRSEVEGSIDRQIADRSVAIFAGQTVTPTPLTGRNEDTALLWRLGAQYFVNDDLNLFATVSRGYKSAGIVSEITVNAVTPGGTDLPVVDPEIPTQYEAGLRFASGDRLVRANLTAFYTDVSDFQTQTLVPRDDGTTDYTVANAGTVETYGFEADFTVQPTLALTLSGALAYTVARVVDFKTAPCYALQTVAEGCVTLDGNAVQDLAGAELPNAPGLTFNALARYDFDLAPDLPMFVQTGVSYRSETFTTITNDPNTIIDGYTLVDAQIGITLFDGTLDLVAFGRNLFDTNFVEAINGTPLDIGGYSQFVTLEAERTFGVRAHLRF